MTETKKMTKEEIFQLKERMKPFISEESKPNYTYYQIKCEQCTITAYTSGKVVFQGKDLEFMQKEKKEQVFPQAGSDEVGTGDYFGPVVVASCILTQEDEQALRSLKIQDSKQINDTNIRKIAKIIKEHSKYSILILNNQKYNVVHQTHNMVDIKCKLHNQAYVNLVHKGYELPKQIVIDQFVQEKSYYRYLQKEKEVIRGIHFETKAENKYLAVAAASILARNAFLEYWDKMEEHYHFTFQKGAGSNVDICAKEFVQQCGKEELGKVAKLHFKNTEKIELFK
ncbi:ribonuclease HIII [Floccifex sp.]|uniref:ribonuclease HIII n=1 Tax=Floccifex sp. TaxID=2815810 RepID=UPI003F107866